MLTISVSNSRLMILTRRNYIIRINFRIVFQLMKDKKNIDKPESHLQCTLILNTLFLCVSLDAKKVLL